PGAPPGGPAPGGPPPAALGSPRSIPDTGSGRAAPAGMPPEILERLRMASVKALQSAELKQQFATQSALPPPTTPAEFAAFVKAEQAKWGPVVVATGVKLE